MSNAITEIAAMIAEPTRADMLLALLGGKALTATELALEGGITPQTASSHLSKLLDAQLISVVKQGRHKYFQLHNREIAHLLENLLVLSTAGQPRAVQTGPSCPSLRRARVCYDHIAGEVGVELFDMLLDKKFIAVDQQSARLTPTGKAMFIHMGAEIVQTGKSRRPLCRPCLDWSERRSHLAGTLGQWLQEEVLKNKWARREPDSRALLFSDYGHRKLMGMFSQ